MAGIRQIARDYKDEIMDGIAWVAIWKTGRAWNARSFWLNDKDRIERDEICDAKKIVAEDPDAIIINEYECAHMGEGTLEDIVAGIRFHYGNGYNKLAEWPDVKSENDGSLDEETLSDPVEVKSLGGDMNKKEFENLTGVEIPDEDYRIIETVYHFHPVVSEVSGEEEVAELYKSFGMVIFYDMLPRAEQNRGLERQLNQAQVDMNYIRQDMEELRRGVGLGNQLAADELLPMAKKNCELERQLRQTQEEVKHIKQDMEELRRGASEGEDAYLSLDKKEFRMTEFGAMMVNIIMEWDQVMHDYYGGLVAWENNPEVEKKFIQCLAQWEVCQVVMRQFYGIEYHFTRTDEYFGICTEDGCDWLVKVDRKPESLFKYKKAINRYGIPNQIYLDEGEIGLHSECLDTINTEELNNTEKKFVPQGNPRHALCKKLERESKRV